MSGAGSHSGVSERKANSIPEELCDEILAQHDEIAELLGQLEKHIEQADSDDPSLREAAARVLTVLSRHLGYEEEHLVPLLEGAGEEGQRQARTLQREHADQHALFEFVQGRLASQRWTSHILARQLLGFVQILRDDILHEEQTLLGVSTTETSE